MLEYFMNTLYSHPPNKSYSVRKRYCKRFANRNSYCVLRDSRIVRTSSPPARTASSSVCPKDPVNRCPFMNFVLIYFRRCCLLLFLSPTGKEIGQAAGDAGGGDAGVRRRALLCLWLSGGAARTGAARLEKPWEKTLVYPLRRFGEHTHPWMELSARRAERL